jgi:hypothetical protein
MMPVRRRQISVAIHDNALFHILLALYAACYNLHFLTGDPVESLRHRMKGIQILNERLEDPARGLSDGSIAAVANVAMYEVCYH